MHRPYGDVDECAPGEFLRMQDGHIARITKEPTSVTLDGNTRRLGLGDSGANTGQFTHRKEDEEEGKIQQL